MTEDNIDTQTFRNIERLHELRVAHRELDLLIEHLVQDPATDELQVRRLKVRKLRLKDLIARLESALIPDLNA